VLKTCNRCGFSKGIGKFHRNSYSPDGFRSTCADCSRKGQADYRSRTKKQKAEYDRKRWSENKERLSENRRAWGARNRAHRNAYILNRYYTQKTQSCGNVPVEIREILFSEQNGLCFYCQKELEQSHLEHKAPIARGGKHERSNVCLSCPTCNLRKGTKTEEEFLGGDDLSFANAR
jgi:hypothetical protein